MSNLQSRVHLVLILLVLVLTGSCFVLLVPVYQGPDEPIHYGTLQYQAEPQEKNWPMTEEIKMHTGKDIREFHLSEEVIAGGLLNHFDDLKWQEANIQPFVENTSLHPEEISFNQTNHKRYIETRPVNASGTTSWYYTLSSLIEKHLPVFSFSERFFLARFFSLLLYLGILVTTFLVAKKIFTTKLVPLLFTILVGCQPMLLATGSIVNIDIALIFSFSLFFLALVSILENPQHKISHGLLVLSFLLAFFAKGPGIVLLPIIVLLYLFLLKKYFILPTRKTTLIGLFVLFFILPIILWLVPETYLTSITRLTSTSLFPTPFHSLLAYFDKTLGPDAFLRTHASYWGTFGWLDTQIHSPLLWLLAAIELTAWLGILLYFLSKKSCDYLPKKTILLFAGIMITCLQCGIRFYDWRTFDITKQLLIGTPGRYFLPTLLPHLLIIVTGLGYLFTKDKTQFTTLLKTLTLGMILLCIYSLFNIIIPRYYL